MYFSPLIYINRSEKNQVLLQISFVWSTVLGFVPLKYAFLILYFLVVPIKIFTFKIAIRNKTLLSSLFPLNLHLAKSGIKTGSLQQVIKKPLSQTKCKQPKMKKGLLLMAHKEILIKHNIYICYLGSMFNWVYYYLPLL